VEVRNYAYDCSDVLGQRVTSLHSRLCETMEPERMARAVDEVLLGHVQNALPRSHMQRAHS
jgi:hypothetical protein